MFFGLKNNGRDLFQNNSKETPFYAIETNIETDDKKKYEAEILIIKLNEQANKGKEYPVSLSKSDTYAEL